MNILSVKHVMLLHFLHCISLYRLTQYKLLILLKCTLSLHELHAIFIKRKMLTFLETCLFTLLMSV